MYPIEVWESSVRGPYRRRPLHRSEYRFIHAGISRCAVPVIEVIWTVCRSLCFHRSHPQSRISSCCRWDWTRGTRPGQVSSALQGFPSSHGLSSWVVEQPVKVAVVGCGGSRPHNRSVRPPDKPRRYHRKCMHPRLLGFPVTGVELQPLELSQEWLVPASPSS